MRYFIGIFYGFVWIFIVKVIWGLYCMCMWCHSHEDLVKEKKILPPPSGWWQQNFEPRPGKHKELTLKMRAHNQTYMGNGIEMRKWVAGLYTFGLISLRAPFLISKMISLVNTAVRHN